MSGPRSAFKPLGTQEMIMSTRFLVTVCTLALLSFPLSAHDADHASDWIGDHELKNANGVPCCGVSDCAELQDDAVTETHAGYVINGWGHYHPHPSLRWTAGHRESADAGGHWDWIKDQVHKTEGLPSEDNHYWRCKSASERTCFLVPPRDF